MRQVLTLTLFATTLAGSLAANVAPAVVAAQPPIGQASELEAYIGAYELEGGAIARIMLRGKELVADVSGARPARLKATTKGVFEAESATPYTVVFDEARDQLRITTSTSMQAGRRITAPTGLLGRYTGTYPLSDTLAMVLTLEGDRLIAQATGASRHPLFPESATRFFVQDSASNDVAHLEFGADPDGKAFVVFRQMSTTQKVYRK